MGGNRAPTENCASVIACWMVFTIGLVSASLAKPRKHGSSIRDSALLCRDVHVRPRPRNQMFAMPVAMMPAASNHL